MGETKQVFEAHGKLMLFGEYVVMRGLPALAFPTKMGQTLTVTPSKDWLWESYESNQLWFSLRFDDKLEILDSNNSAVANKLISILKDIQAEKPECFDASLRFVVHSNFNRNWGFGSSATLISLISQWSGVDGFRLNDKHFGGSGYDIACAVAQGPIWYERETRMVREVHVAQTITDQLLFIYLGKKQNSQRELTKFSTLLVSDDKLHELRRCICEVLVNQGIGKFEEIVDTHEELLSAILLRPTLKESEFPDYPFSVKSLGAWGGDFFMATCRNIDESRMYFLEKGYEVAFTYDMLKV